MSSVLYHFEWFRREMERHVCDDGDEERAQHVKYLLDVMEQRIRCVRVVPSVRAKPRAAVAGGMPPGLHRIVGGRITTLSRSAPVARTRPVKAVRRWYLCSSRHRAWVHEIVKASRHRR